MRSGGAGPRPSAGASQPVGSLLRSVEGGAGGVALEANSGFDGGVATNCAVFRLANTRAMRRAPAAALQDDRKV